MNSNFSEEKKLRVAVIGVGNMGRNHARVYSELASCELVAVCDTNKTQSESIAKKYGAKAYTEYEKMFSNEKPQLISIAVPTKYHLSVALAAIRYGIHVLLEKPIAINVAEAEQIIEAAKKARVKLLIGHIERFNSAVVELKKRLDQGQLGAVYKVHAQRLSPFPNQVNDVGVTLDIAIHDIDLIRYITSSEVIDTYSAVKKRINTNHEDLLVSILTMENDIVGTLDVNWVTPTKQRLITVTGERGMFVVDSMTHDLYFYENAALAGITNETYQLTMSEGDMVKYKIIKTEPLRAEIEHIIECVLHDKTPRVSGEDGLIALRTALRILAETHTV